MDTLRPPAALIVAATGADAVTGRAPTDLTLLAMGVVLASAVLGAAAVFGLISGLFGSKPGDAAT